MYLSQSINIASRTIGDDTIIMSTLDSTVFILNTVGTAIWNGADGVTSLSTIIEDKVCAAFEVKGEQATTDAKEFVKQLVEYGLLVASDSPMQREEAQ